MAEQADDLEELLKQCTVRLEIGDGHGTGFFVAPGLVLTCAHVVEQYREGEPTGKPTEEPIKAVWSAGDAEDPRAEVREFRPNPHPDLALLTVDVDDHPCVPERKPTASTMPRFPRRFLDAQPPAARG